MSESETEPEDDVKFTLRIPKDIYEAAVKYAKGSAGRPKTSINNTLVFLIRYGLAQQQRKQAENPDNRRTLQPALA